MKTFLKLCFSVIRKNKGFTAGLIIMSVLSVSIAFLGANFGASSDTTVMSYLSESGTPDAIFSTDMMPCSAADEILAVDGVALVSPRLVFDTHMELDSGEPYSVRVLGFDKDAPFRQSVYESVKLNKKQNGVMLSRDFAEKNGIHAGDKITLSVSPGFLAKHDFTVEAVISNPETMNCVKDDMSAYESSQFGYVYIDNDKLNEIIYSSVAGLIPFVSSEQMRSVLSDYAAPFSEEAGGQASQWLLYFDEGLSRDEEKAIMKNVEDVLGGHFISGSYTDESEALTSLRDDLGTISVLCSFIPCVIWLISLGFSFIFIKIIIENQRKTIGLLRALGYTAKKVVLIFVLYTVMINVIAALLGLPLGYGLLKLGLGAISSAEGIPEYKITLLWGTTVLMTGVVFVIGIAASLFSSGAISKIDPSAAYGGSEAAPYEPPKFIANAKTDAFFKISLVSAFRNYKRQIIGALCISACVISMCIGFEGVFTIGHPIDALYGGRFRYDLLIRNIDGGTCEKIAESITGADIIEPVTLFTEDLDGEKVRVSSISESSSLTVLENADGDVIFPGGGIIIDEMRAKLNGLDVGDTVTLGGKELEITGIAREILYNVMYVSPDTAADLGYSEPNGLMIKLGDGADIKKAERQISDIDKNAYFTELSLQKEDIKSGFAAMRTVMFMFAVLAFAIGSLLIINLSIIDFNENKIKHATLRAIGTPVGRFAVISLVENLSRVLLGVIVALPVCKICVGVLLGLLSNASQQYVFTEYGKCLAAACAIPFLYVLFGILVSLRKIKKMNFNDCLSEVE